MRMPVFGTLLRATNMIAENWQSVMKFLALPIMMSLVVEYADFLFVDVLGMPYDDYGLSGQGMVDFSVYSSLYAEPSLTYLLLVISLSMAWVFAFVGWHRSFLLRSDKRGISVLGFVMRMFMYIIVAILIFIMLLFLSVVIGIILLIVLRFFLGGQEEMSLFFIFSNLLMSGNQPIDNLLMFDWMSMISSEISFILLGLFLSASFVLLYYSVRWSIAYAAVSIQDRFNESPRNAWRLTSGNGWRLVIVMLIPFLVVSSVNSVLGELSLDFYVVEFALEIAWLLLSTAVLSAGYEFLSNRSNLNETTSP